MHKLIDIFNYKDKSLYGDYGKTTCNQEVKYDVEFNLRLNMFKAYYKSKVYTALLKSDFYQNREIKSAIGISSYTNASSFAIKLTDYLAENTMMFIYSLTRFDSYDKYDSVLKTGEIRIPNNVLDLSRAINCHYRMRLIEMSDSVLNANKVTVNTDLSDKQLEKIDYIYLQSLKLCKVLEITGIDQSTIITDYRELYRSNDFDMSVSCNLIKGNNNFNFVVGDANTDEEVICGLLIQPNYTNTENYYIKTHSYVVPYDDCINILEFGEVKSTRGEEMAVIEDLYVKAVITSKFTSTANKRVGLFNARSKNKVNMTSNKPRNFTDIRPVKELDIKDDENIGGVDNIPS